MAFCSISRSLTKVPAILSLRNHTTTSLPRWIPFLQRHQYSAGVSLRTLYTGYLHLHGETVNITFIDRCGATRETKAVEGETLLDVAKKYDVDGVEGACDGTLACSTCHCVFKQEDFDRFELDDITEDELDMLDLAFGLTETSRLGCQVDVVKEMDGMVVTVPTSTNDARV